MDLTITQRLNLGFMLGEQRGNVAHVRACLAIMDKIDPSEEERKAANLRPLPGGLVAWDDPGDVKEIALSGAERALLKSIVEAGPIRPSDLKWVEPLLANL